MTNREETGKYGYWYMCTQGNKLRHDTQQMFRDEIAIEETTRHTDQYWH